MLGFPFDELTVAMEPEPLVNTTRGGISPPNVQDDRGNGMRNGMLHDRARDARTQPSASPVATSVDVADRADS